ncbi:UDP-N-acetylglucosamine--N-acetylmuramyl-(pentapeptide) pyrophosphoryl-undecaprenol N-acetylglucosamine transferase [Streptomyces sp. S3(2020)]|uniref:UDP-N-acetylglucosamine--N-acetylmuramyl- (pentapeptide) pyrophosphoryl-undecaprenol N-acetylglucosamine transferase n=1 Tax=Streptomyces sp. S3(2020) TaxID=2732044 RepID=UPI0014877818|nr:UDP-N-acetylglucosamine--N-acetylmuramyl-(pentapeptide) pyrophosphoryl-undecaprenol N-acetylglucosamine transferase [Streptomyces sp. S3(2020)]NNN34637.1 UDP-N-acetylglucosamine--N-acetylmuramyl-(pentapeptide) pyrophosphoryl-undecaprenol N-acetylglucosamine transferase [Streptomyces sp. S3(2020)]
MVTGGGTGGHTYPALTAVRTMETVLAQHGATLDVLWVGTAEGLEARVAPAEGIAFKTVPTGKLRRSSNPLKMLNAQNMRDLGRVPKGVVEARAIAADYKADVILSTGGYVAVPVGLAARATKTKLVVHEQTVRLGLANRILARSATAVAVSSESTLKLLPNQVAASAVVTGNPVRPAVFTGDESKAVSALGMAGYTEGLPTVYVTGGAQGSEQINGMVRENLPWLLSVANVVHQCGPNLVEKSRQFADSLPAELSGRYWVDGFVGPELPDVLALASVVVARSGAGTISELTALGKPSVLVPLVPSAGDEQEHNALHLQDAGAAVALVRERANAEQLRLALEPVLSSGGRRDEMAQAARTLGKPDAAMRLVEVLLNVALGESRRA